jgi:NDP-sugar pyrophosphorylase family protein
VDSLANVHSSAIVEVGAVVHAHAHVGPNTRILSGCIVGPNVNVGSSTTLGFASSLPQSPHLFFERERERTFLIYDAQIGVFLLCFFMDNLHGGRHHRFAWGMVGVARYNVVLQNCSVGNSCILHSGVCVGQDGVYTMSLSIFVAAAQSSLFVFLSLLPQCSLHYVSFFLSCCSAVYFTMSFSVFLLHNV